jgi:riboflavin synthase
MQWLVTMFSGLVEAVGRVDRVQPAAAGLELRIECEFERVVDGESIAVNGVCLTVREHGTGWFLVAAGEMTVQRTNVGRWAAGTRVNLERALRVGDRLGGHLVQGHVDGVGTVVRVSAAPDVLFIDIHIPADLAELVVPLGSVTIDGVSLTVNAVPASGTLQVGVIDYTRRHTTLGALRPGDEVHVEADVIARYVRQLLAPYVPVTGQG